MSQNRTPRELETRDEYKRPENWAPPETLPTPNPQAGWVFRWIRTAIYEQDDPSNVNRARREGFEPVKASEHPEISIIRDQRAEGRDTIEVGGLMLCKAPEKFVQQRTQHYASMTKQAQMAVDNSLMREQDSRMPLFKESKTKVSFGSGGE